MTDNFRGLEAICCNNKLIWRKSRITINFNIYYDISIAVREKRKAELMEQRVTNCKGDQKYYFISYIVYFGV